MYDVYDSETTVKQHECSIFEKESRLKELICFKETRLSAVKTRIGELEDKLGVKSQ